MEKLRSRVAVLYTRLRPFPEGGAPTSPVPPAPARPATSPERIIRLSEYLQPDWCERVLADLPTLIFPKAGHEDDILKALERVPHLRVWHRKDVPAYLRYGSNPNVAPIVALPDNGWLVSEDGRVKPGNHGFDPTASDLYVPFRAEGPNFKRGYVRTELFDNTCIYPLLAYLLDIEPAPCDGNLDQVSDLLEP